MQNQDQCYPKIMISSILLAVTVLCIAAAGEGKAVRSIVLVYYVRDVTIIFDWMSRLSYSQISFNMLSCSCMSV